MKDGIHPKYLPCIFVDGEHEIVSSSTMTSGKTRTVEGVEYYIHEVAISSFTHPFWTGQQKLMDTAGRVERFNRKYGRS
jgi:large subunit ribosomal protein L31